MNSREREQIRASMQRIQASPRGMVAGFVRALAIHDLLPYDSDQRGLTVGQLQERLLTHGEVRLPKRMIQRDLVRLSRTMYVSYDKGPGKTRYWWRLHGDSLLNLVKEPQDDESLACSDIPDFPSEIEVGLDQDC
ncbi:MAG: hypothetical protein ACNA7J_06275 [Wenzhouxiangella sp.]